MTQEEIKIFIEMIRSKGPADLAPFSYGEWWDGWVDAINWVSSELEKKITSQKETTTMPFTGS